MIKHIIFDLGGVVVPDPSDLIFRNIADFLCIKVNEFAKLTKELKPKTTTGEITLKDMYANVLKQLDKNIDANKVLKKHLELYRKYGTARNQKVLELVRKLRRSYEVACLTNTEVEITDFNRKNGLFDYFDKAYISTEMGMKKPDPEIYLKILNDLNSKPEETVFTDDKKINIKAAKRLGIHGIVYKNIEQLKNDLSRILA